MPMRAEPGSRNLWVFGATSFLNDTASEMAYWILPAFLISIGAGPATLGLIEGIAESVASVAKLFSGYLTDRISRRKPLVVAGYTVANAVKPALAVAGAWWQVLLIRFADRLAKGARGAPRDVMLAESVPEEKLGAAFGLLQAMDTAGAIAGPALALLIVGWYGYRGVFWAAGVPGGLAILVAWLGIQESPRHSPALAPDPAEDRLDAQPQRGGMWKSGTRDGRLPRSFYWLLAATAIFSLGNSSDMFLVLRAETAGIAARNAPLLGLAFNVTYTALSWPAGRLADRTSKQVLAAAGYLVFAGVYAVFGAAPSAAALWAAMASYGLFYALTNPVLRALIAARVPAGSRGRALGIYFFVSSVAVLLASVITGELWKHYGPRLPFYLSAGLSTAAALMLLFLREDKDGSVREAAGRG
jgi:MFS family permease